MSYGSLGALYLLEHVCQALTVTSLLFRQLGGINDPGFMMMVVLRAVTTVERACERGGVHD